MRFAAAILLGSAVLAAPATAGQNDRIAEQQTRAKVAICKTFGSYCEQALDVSWCESKWYIWAQNGEYLGIFQMGAWERARYGHGPGAWAQARAAFRYFVASGRDWSPWSCRP
jgi:hypothetical protein